MGRVEGYTRPTLHCYQGTGSRGINARLRWLIRLGILSQYSNSTAIKDPNVQQKVLLVGNSVKSMQVSVKGSLKRLRTDYIDLFYLHWWDYSSSIQEIMHALHGLVLSGKVLYLVRAQPTQLLDGDELIATV